jgi:hypothetical protein
MAREDREERASRAEEREAQEAAAMRVQECGAACHACEEEFAAFQEEMASISLTPETRERIKALGTRIRAMTDAANDLPGARRSTQEAHPQAMGVTESARR